MVPAWSRDGAVELGPAHRLRLAELCRQCTDFFALIEGRPGGVATAEEILGPLPDHVVPGTKRVFGIERAGDLVGVVEILAGFPGPGDWQIGLLLLAPPVRNAGMGTGLWRDLRTWIAAQGAATVRLVVQQQNPSARRFWERQGFRLEREAVVTAGTLASPVWVLRLHLAVAAPPAVDSGAAAPQAAFSKASSREK